MLDTQIDDDGEIIYPPYDDYNPGGPGPWPPDYTDPSVITPSVENPMTPRANGPAPQEDPPPGGGPGPFTGTFNAPTPRGLPSLPSIPNAPIPNLPSYTPPPAFAYDPYQQAAPFTYDAWNAPSPEEALNDPGYQFRLSQGEGALQRWAAAKGTLNDSGTAQSLIEHGQNAATQEYQNVWNRDLNAYQLGRTNALDTYNVNEANRFKAYDTNRAGAVQAYNTNYQTQYADPYEHAYKAAIDTWIPQQEQWKAGVDMSQLGYSTQYAGTLHQNDMDYNNSWAQFLQSWNDWRDRRDTGIVLAGT